MFYFSYNKRKIKTEKGTSSSRWRDAKWDDYQKIVEIAKILSRNPKVVVYQLVTFPDNEKNLRKIDKILSNKRFRKMSSLIDEYPYSINDSVDAPIKIYDNIDIILLRHENSDSIFVLREKNNGYCVISKFEYDFKEVNEKKIWTRAYVFGEV